MDQKITKDLQNTVSQAKAPVLTEVTQASGQGALTPVQSVESIVPIEPGHLDTKSLQKIETETEGFITKIKADPSDWQLGNFVFNLGQEIMQETQSQVTLYDRKMGNVLKNVSTEESSSVGKNILAIKLELDKVNPTVVSNTNFPFPKKVAGSKLWVFLQKQSPGFQKGMKF